jgi:hypothetical protein
VEGVIDFFFDQFDFLGFGDAGEVAGAVKGEVGLVFAFFIAFDFVVPAAEAEDVPEAFEDVHGRAAFGADEGGVFSFADVSGDELVEAFCAAVFLGFGARVASEFPEALVPATGAMQVRVCVHDFPFGLWAGTVLPNMNRNLLSRKDLNHSLSCLLR